MRFFFVILTALFGLTALMPMLSYTSCKAGDGRVGNTQAQETLFAPAPNSPFPVGKQPVSTAVGDLNGDGKLDIVTANAGSNNATVLLGDGRGRFEPSLGSPFKTGKTPEFIAIGDLNKDGKPDLAIAPHDGGYDVTILLGDGKGGFRSAPNSPLSPLRTTNPHTHALVLGDINGDGNLDIVTANAGANKGKADNSVSVLLGNNRGGFRRATHSPFQLGRMPAGMVLGDLNRDRKLDLVTTHEGSKDISVILGSDKGGFDVAAGLRFALPAYGNSVATGDVDMDANPDLVITHDDSGLMTILLGDGQGDFKPAPGSPFDIGHHGWNIIVIDVNGDKKLDLAMRSQNNTIVVLLGNGSGNFTSAKGSPFTVGERPLNITTGDINADGKLDILTANSGSNNVTVLLGK